MLLMLFLILPLFYKEVVGQCSNTNPCMFTQSRGETLQQPDEEVSNGQSISFTLTVNVTEVTIDWLTLYRRTFNGKIPGPTWRVRRGDVVTVTLDNRLTRPHKEEALNEQRLPNSTNLHTHGLHISSIAPQDDVFVHVPPGGRYTYVYEIDADQPAGTYWYHPHLHGSTIFQVHSGMAGMIIVEDPTSGPMAAPQHLANVSCPNNCQHDIQLLFQPTLSYINNARRGFANLQRTIQDDQLFRHNQFTVTSTSPQTSLEAWLEDQANGVDHFTTNGQIFPNLTLTTGQIKRFRMVNAGGSATLELIVVDSQGNKVCTYREIAVDGIYLDQARVPAFDKTLLPPSGKADWLIVCNTAGTYQLRSMPSADDAASIGGFQRHSGLLLTIIVTGADTSTTLGTSLPARETFVQDFRGLTQEQVAGRFVIEAGPGTQLNRVRFSSDTDYRFKSELGTVQEWYLTNIDPNLGHPIHIHVNHFQIISYNAYTGLFASGQRGGGNIYASQNGEVCHFQQNNIPPGTTSVRIPPEVQQYINNGHDQRVAAGGVGTLGYVPIGDFRDVIIVPPLANITIRFMAHRHLGKVVMHCHILSHEDTGMMMTTEIVNPGSDLTANTNTPYGYPGQCAMCDPFPFNEVGRCSEVTSTTVQVTSTTAQVTSRASSLQVGRWILTFLVFLLLQLNIAAAVYEEI